MPSPFPGMNPYLENSEFWHDFHERFVPKLAEAITAEVRPDYFCKIDEHVYIHEMSARERLIGRSDVSVKSDEWSSHGDQTASTTAPARGRVSESIDVERINFIEVRDRSNREVVTVVELLSPSNKSGGDRNQYLAKRRSYFESRVHLVEIDLLRGGPRLPIDETPDCDYLIMVSRSPMRPEVELWPINIDEPLPVIPIPLRDGRDEAIINLQIQFEAVFEAAAYQDYIYASSPEPPLSDGQRLWAEQTLERDTLK
ncbi:DUF4058 family protein [Stratiformator vulcanicus]|uniref:DUF4058 domain-containing protein n=1 Tax=Stratiformator vulcanicus TaxID=2527980 RepID=A0A517R6B6_9PLAN|nr:DUF4058 family protein [Stratiformator vulcanicus]QDT39383.1 hypothetical protein Pan189_37900 [Stratiformator vulcanicus]